MAMEWVKTVGKFVTQFFLPMGQDDNLGIRASRIAEYIADNGTAYGISYGNEVFGPETPEVGTLTKDKDGNYVLRVQNDDTEAIATMQNFIERGPSWIDLLKAPEDPVEAAREKAKQKLDRIFKPAGENAKEKLASMGIIRGGRRSKAANMTENEAQAILDAVTETRDNYAKELAAPAQA